MFYTPEQKKAYYTQRMNDPSLTEGQRKYAKEFLETADMPPFIKRMVKMTNHQKSKRERHIELEEKWKDEKNRTVKGAIEQIRGLSYRSPLKTVRVTDEEGRILYWGRPYSIPHSISLMMMDSAVPSRHPDEKYTYIITTKGGLK